MYPFSTASIVDSSSNKQNLSNSGLLSNLALWASPLDQAKIDAIGFVDVFYPFYHYLKCLVTVPWAASDSRHPSSFTKTDVISPRDPKPYATMSD